MIERARAIAAAHAHREGPLLPVLQAVQAEFGYIDDSVVPGVAHELNLTRAEVHGVITFYHDFRRTPPGRQIVRVCVAEACQARGSRAVVQGVEAALRVRLGETRPDGAYTLDAVYCLGLCASGPAAVVDGALVGRLDVQGLIDRLNEVAR